MSSEPELDEDYPQLTSGFHSDKEVRQALDEIRRLRATVARMQNIVEMFQSDPENV